jgi:hypothetical protein
VDRIVVAITIFMFVFLAAAPAVTQAQPGAGTASLVLGRYPGISANLSSGIQIDMKTVGLILVINYTNEAVFGPSYVPALIPYISNFSNESWGFVSGNGSREYTYSANITFRQAGPGLAEALSGQLVGNLSFFNEENTIKAHIPMQFQAKVYVNISKTAVSSQRMSISGAAGNYTYDNLSSSTVGINFNVIFNQPIGYNGSLILIQKLGVVASGPLTSEDFRAKLERGGAENRGFSVGNGGLEKAMAYYWWKGTYAVNGVSQNLSYATKMQDNAVFVAYFYNFSTGNSVFYQDPYLTIPGLNLSNVNIIGPANEVIQFIVLHSELIASGLVIGILLIAAPYAVYRKRRIT